MSRKRLLGHAAGLALATLAAFAPAAPGSHAAESRVVWMVRSGGAVERLSPARLKALSRFDDKAAVAVPTIAITWLVDYRDSAEHTGLGFDDPAQGAARKKAFEETLQTIGATLGGGGARTVKVRVERSGGLEPGKLAEASSPLVTAANATGFFKSDLQNLIQTGVDPNPALADMMVAFAFNGSWHTDASSPPATSYDLRSIALHEITHALGMRSLLGPDGKSRLTGANPGAFSTLDSFLAKPTGLSLMTASGLFTGAPSDTLGADGGLAFAGPQTRVAMGYQAKLYTPPSFSPGSSLSHWGMATKSPVMEPFSGKGVRRRVYADYEIAMLRDLGYTQASGPKQALRFSAPTAFATTSIAPSAAVVQDFDDRPGLDLVVLDRDGANRPILTIYSGLDPAQRVQIALPRDIAWTRMSPAKVGPDRLSGVVLMSMEQGRLLSLAGFKYPGAAGVTVDFSKLAHVHQVSVFAPEVSGAPIRDPGIAAGDLNGDGEIDYVGASKQGFLPFVNDGRGLFDRLLNRRALQPIGELANLVHGVSAYQTQGPPLRIGLAVSASRSIGDPFIAMIADPAGTLQTGKLDNSGEGYAARVLARAGAFGYAALEKGGDQDFARLDLSVAPYKVKTRWRDTPRLTGVAAMGDAPYDAFVATAGHGIETVRGDSDALVRLAGGVAGYLDGPAAQARFKEPGGLCLADKTLFVVDTGNGVLRQIDLTTKTVSTLAGQAGVFGLTDGPRGVGTFKFAAEGGSDTCAVIGDSIFVANGAGPNGPFRLRKVNRNTGYVTTVSTADIDETLTIRHLAALGPKLFFMQGRFATAILWSGELAPSRSPQSSSQMLLLADLDRDTKADLINLYEPSTRALAVHRSNGDGGFQPLDTYVLATQPSAIAAADVDQDGAPDIVVGGAAGVEVLRGDGKGALAQDPTRKLSLANIQWLKVADLNRDGRADLATLDGGATLKVFLADASGRWGGGPFNDGEHVSQALGDHEAVVWFDLADYDGDGLLDLLAFTVGTGRVLLHKGAPAGL